jgi:hypothetical protein
MASGKYRIWGHGAARFSMDQLLDSRKQMNRVRADFLKTNLQTALTFLKIARQTTDDIQRRRSCRAARKAYDSLLALTPQVDLNDHDSRLARQGLTELRSDLEALGEVF